MPILDGRNPPAEVRRDRRAAFPIVLKEGRNSPDPANGERLGNEVVELKRIRWPRQAGRFRKALGATSPIWK